MRSGFASSIIVFASAIVLIPTDVSAQAAGGAVQVAVRAASFLVPSLSGPVVAAIVYEDGDAASEQEARLIERSLISDGRVKAMSLKPRRVASDALEQLAGAKVAFVTRGTNYRQVGSAAAARSILTISFDSDCARAGHCVLAVSTRPKVQIAVSGRATTAAKLRFSSSFLMLVKEL